MKKVVIIAAKTAKKMALHALKHDANCTTCLAVYQPEVPNGLNLLKRTKDVHKAC